MARPKKEAILEDGIKGEDLVVVPIAEKLPLVLPLEVDYPNEGLNNLARKINEVIEFINSKF